MNGSPRKSIFSTCLCNHQTTQRIGRKVKEKASSMILGETVSSNEFKIDMQLTKIGTAPTSLIARIVLNWYERSRRKTSHGIEQQQHSSLFLRSKQNRTPAMAM